MWLCPHCAAGTGAPATSPLVPRLAHAPVVEIRWKRRAHARPSRYESTPICVCVCADILDEGVILRVRAGGVEERRVGGGVSRDELLDGVEIATVAHDGGDGVKSGVLVDRHGDGGVWMSVCVVPLVGVCVSVSWVGGAVSSPLAPPPSVALAADRSSRPDQRICLPRRQTCTDTREGQSEEKGEGREESMVRECRVSSPSFPLVSESRLSDAHGSRPSSCLVCLRLSASILQHAQAGSTDARTLLALLHHHADEKCRRCGTSHREPRDADSEAAGGTGHVRSGRTSRRRTKRHCRHHPGSTHRSV